MYRLRQMAIDDKVCQEIDVALVEKIYPKEVIQRCVQESEPWKKKDRRVRKTTAVALVWLLIGMGLWSRLNQAQVWQKLVGKLSAIHPGAKPCKLSDSGISGRRKALASGGLQRVMQTCCVPRADAATMPWAFFGRYRLMANDGTLFNTADTPANDEAFGGSSNQYGKGAYPQVRGVLLSECGTHLVVGIQISGYLVSEVHGAQALLRDLGANQLVMVDAGITSGGLLERAREQGTHVLGAVAAGTWQHLSRQRRLRDGSVLAWLAPSKKGSACYPVQRGLWVRILSYRFTDERLGEAGKVYRLVTTLLNPRTAPALALIALYHERWEIELVIDEVKTHECMQRKVLRSKTPEGVVQEIYGLFLAHYLVRVLMAQAAQVQDLDPDRLSFSEGLFHLTEMIDLTLILEPEAAVSLLPRLYENMREKRLPPRHLRINRREVKQVYNKHKPKKRNAVPAKPFEPHEQFLDFVEVLDPLSAWITPENGVLK